MTKSHAAVALAAFCLLLTIPTLVCAQDQSAKWEPLVQAMKDVLAGKPIVAKNIIISSGAYAIVGKQFEHLTSVASGDSKSCSLKEDSTRNAVSVNVRMNDSENAAFVTLKTVSNKTTAARYHTAIFMKDTQGKWLIEMWQMSE